MPKKSPEFPKDESSKEKFLNEEEIEKIFKEVFPDSQKIDLDKEIQNCQVIQKFIDPTDPTKGLKTEKKYFYNFRGKLIKMEITDFINGNFEIREFKYDENGRLISAHTQISKGPDQGYEKQIFYQTSKTGKILTEKEEVLRRGINRKKPKKGSWWFTKYLYDIKGKWLGKITMINLVGEERKIVSEGKVLPEDVEDFLEEINKTKI